jgi:L-iditol 2-dehydrogenase
MLAVRFYSPGQLKAEQVPIPRAGRGELVVRSAVALTCGTDVKMYKRGHPLAKLPEIIGHEFAGTVVEVGEGIKRFMKGMRVVAANSAPCSKCFFCQRKQPNLCEHLNESIIGFTWPGTYAEFVRIPEKIVNQNTFQVPDGTPLENVASLEPLSCVVHGWDLVRFDPGGTVVIIGGGPIGLLHVQLAKLHGAKQVILTDIVKDRLSEARNIGTDLTINSSESNLLKEILNLTGSRGADLVIEAVGRKETWESTTPLVRKGGTILLFGGCPAGSEATFSADKMHYGELQIQGAFHHTPAAVERAFNLISSGQVAIKPIISHQMPLERAEEALQLMGNGKALKVALIPPKS